MNRTTSALIAWVIILTLAVCLVIQLETAFDNLQAKNSMLEMENAILMRENESLVRFNIAPQFDEQTFEYYKRLFGCHSLSYENKADRENLAHAVIDFHTQGE